MKQELEFKLNNPIKESQVNIDSKNTTLDIDTLYLKAPTRQHRSKTMLLKQAFLSAQELRSMKIFATGVLSTFDKLNKESVRQNDDSEESDGTMDIDTIRDVILKSDKDCIDIVNFCDNFTKLILSQGICFKSEESKNAINNSDLDKITEEDFESLMIQYIWFFLTASWSRKIE